MGKIFLDRTTCLPTAGVGLGDSKCLPYTLKGLWAIILNFIISLLFLKFDDME